MTEAPGHRDRLSDAPTLNFFWRYQERDTLCHAWVAMLIEFEPPHKKSLLESQANPRPQPGAGQAAPGDLTETP